MYSEFAKLLIHRRILIWEAKRRRKFPEHLTDKIKVLSVIEWMKLNNINDVPQVLCVDILPYIREYYNEASYKLCSIKVRKLSEWITKNLILTIAEDSYRTINVKLRIATDMMNRLEYEGVISNNTAVIYFSNIIANIKELKNNVEMDKLPF